jgi:chromosome segregation ATPase
MVVTLKKEQVDDDKKKDYCNAELDAAEDRKKETDYVIKDLETKIADIEEEVGTLADEIKALQEGIATLDTNVAKATEQRKEENTEYTQLMASNTAAKELIGMAKNRMNKFYNPKMYKPPPKRELTEEERITLNMGGTLEPTAPPGGIAGTGVTALVDVKAHKADPGPPPETFGDYIQKKAESNGVLAMMDGLVKELDQETTEATAEEKDAQGDYEGFMSDSTDKRAEDSKTLLDTSSAKAEAETELENSKGAKKSAKTDLDAIVTMIKDLHADCDFLLENFDLRAEARAGEIDALGKAKAVLNGADYS